MPDTPRNGPPMTELKAKCRPKLTMNISYDDRCAFKAACDIQGEEMASVVMKFIKSYIAAHKPTIEQLRAKYDHGNAEWM